MKKILFSAIALATVSVAGAQTAKNLVVTETDGNKVEFAAGKVEGIIFQDAPQYIQITDLINTRYEESDDKGVYTVQIGTAETDDCVIDMYLQLLMTGPKAADIQEPALPEGYYRTGNGKEEWTFDINKSILWMRVKGSGEDYNPSMLIDGTIDVRRDGDGTYDIRLELVTFGSAIDIRYTGDMYFQPGVSEYNPFTEPVDMDFEGGQGRFYGNWYYPFAADLTMQFYSGTIEDGVFKHGYVLYLDFCEPKPEDEMAPEQIVADGVYTAENRQVQSSQYIPYRYNKGAITDFMGAKYLTATRLEYISPNGERKLGLITDGTFTVSDKGTEFVFDFLTKEGVKVTGRYDGKPYIQNFCDNDEKAPKRPFSTLTSDVKLNWDPATVALSYCGGPTILDDATTMVLMLTVPSLDKGDYVSLEMFVDGETVPDGTFKIGRELASGNIIPGAVDFAGSMIFSWYGDLGLVDEEGYNTTLGPLESGTVTISTLDNGERKVVFDMVDDNGNVVAGEYVGVIIDGNSVADMGSRMMKDAKRGIRREHVTRSR